VYPVLVLRVVLAFFKGHVRLRTIGIQTEIDIIRHEFRMESLLRISGFVRKIIWIDVLLIPVFIFLIFLVIFTAMFIALIINPFHLVWILRLFERRFIGRFKR
jgi:hypothetical protein